MPTARPGNTPRKTVSVSDGKRVWIRTWSLLCRLATPLLDVLVKHVFNFIFKLDCLNGQPSKVKEKKTNSYDHNNIVCLSIVHFLRYILAGVPQDVGNNKTQYELRQVDSSGL